MSRRVGSEMHHTPGRCFAVIAVAVAFFQVVEAQVVCTGVDRSITDEIGTGWTQVRKTPTDWHPAQDRLDGYSVYGNEGNNSEPWSIRFDNTDFGEFLFASGDCRKWLIASRFAVTGDLYTSELRTVTKSSLSNTSYLVRWSHTDNVNDPLVRISDSPEDIVYRANALQNAHTAEVGGFSVYIRGRACSDGYALTYNVDEVIGQLGCVANVACDGVVDSVSGRCWKYFRANGFDHPSVEYAVTACESWGGYLASFANLDDRIFADRLMIEHGVSGFESVWVGLKPCNPVLKAGGNCWEDGLPFMYTSIWDSGWGQPGPNPNPCTQVWRRTNFLSMLSKSCDLSGLDESNPSRSRTAGFLCATASWACPAGMYGLGNGNCQACPSGGTSISGLNKGVNSCHCPAGSALEFASGECVPHPTCTGTVDASTRRCWWIYSDTKKDWFTAESTCQADGGHLASILTPEDKQVATALFRDSGRSGFEQIWTGLHRSSGAWRWSEGSAYDLILWDSGWGQPAGPGQCARMWERIPNTAIAMRVNDCNSPSSFLCASSSVTCGDGEYGDGLRCARCPMNGTSTAGRNRQVYGCLCPNGMAMLYRGDGGEAEAACVEHPTCVGILDVRTNRCWKLFHEEQEWAAAEATCNIWGSVTGGHLASITSGEDRELGRALLRSAGTLKGSQLWVGLRRTSTWTWADGSPYSLNLWDTGWGQPAGGDCAMIWERVPRTNINFVAQVCDSAFSFLCASPAPVCPDNTYGDGLRCETCPGGGTSTSGRNLHVAACVCPQGLALSLTRPSSPECVTNSWCNGLIDSGRCWGYVHGNQAWQDADASCQAWNSEGHLASIRDSAEREIAIKLYQANANVMWDKVWVGLSRLEDASYWQWQDETAPVWLPWDGGWGQLHVVQPCSAAWTRQAQGNHMDLVRLACDDASVTGTLCNTPAPRCPHDTYGTWPTCVSCPANSTSVMGRNTEVLSCRCLGGLVMDLYEQKCVNISTCSEGIYDWWEKRCWTVLKSNVTTWEAARATCAAWGGDLAALRTSWEVAAAAKIYRAFGNKARNSLWIGSKRVEGKDKWTWTDGSPYRVNPLVWDLGRPASGTSEQCGVLWSEGTTGLVQHDGEQKLRDLSCDNSKGYVTGALCSTRQSCEDNSFWNSAERSCTPCPNGGTSKKGRNYGIFSCRCPESQSLSYNNLIQGQFIVECLYEPDCDGGVEDVINGVCLQYNPADKADDVQTRRMDVVEGKATVAAALEGCSSQGMMLFDATAYSSQSLVLPALLMDAQGLGVQNSVWINGSSDEAKCTVLKRDLDGVPVVEERECLEAVAEGYICSRKLAVTNTEVTAVVHSSCPGCTFLKTLTETVELGRNTLLRQGTCDVTCSFLDLSNKGIWSISDSVFRDLPDVWSLDLSSNQIRSIDSGAFESMINLKALDISGNGMQNIKLGALDPLTSLEVFRLTDNELSYLETGLLHPLLVVREMRLSENPWHCQPLFPPSLRVIDVDFQAAALPNCLPQQCEGQSSAQAFAGFADFRVGIRAMEQVMAVVRSDVAKLIDETNLNLGMYIKDTSGYEFRRCWCLETLQCFDILPLSNRSSASVKQSRFQDHDAWTRIFPKKNLKLKATTILVGMTLKKFDSRAQDVFKEKVAMSQPGKTKQDIKITGKKEVSKGQQGRKLLALFGVQVDYELEGFESAEAVVVAATAMDEATPDLLTELQDEKMFDELVAVNTFFDDLPDVGGGSCFDERINGGELQVDCGGPDCSPCPCTGSEPDVCHMLGWCAATQDEQPYPTGDVIDPEITQWPPTSSEGRFECGCFPAYLGHGYGPNGCEGKGWAVRVVYKGVGGGGLSGAAEAQLLLLMGGLTCTRGTVGSSCDHIYYDAMGQDLGVNVLFRHSVEGKAAAEAAAAAFNAAAPRQRRADYPVEVDPRLGARVYRWTAESTASPVEVLPAGMEVRSVHWERTCAETGCWVLTAQYTTGSSNLQLDTFNTFFLPYAIGSDTLSYDYSYADNGILDTFQASNFPCRTSDYTSTTGSVRSLPERATGCCFGAAFNASVSELGGDGGGSGLLGRYRVTQAFAEYATAVYPDLCPDNGINASTPKPEDRFPDGVKAQSHLATSFLASSQQFTGMGDSPGIWETRALDPFIGQYEAVIKLDERELRTKAGLLKGTVGVEHTIDSFLGYASFKPATSTWILDSIGAQTAIHLERTSFFSVSTHGVNDYTFLAYVNLRLVAIYDQGDESNTNTAHYVQVTFTLGSKYGVNSNSNLIPLDSVRAGKGTFFDIEDVAGNLHHKCLEYTRQPANAFASWATVALFNNTLKQSCGPGAAMCVSPSAIPDSFVSFNIPLGLDFLGAGSNSLDENVFVDMVISAVDTQARTAMSNPNGGEEPWQMKTTLTASIPVVDGGVNIFCDSFTAKTDLKDVATVDIIVGSASSSAELSRLRIIQDVARSRLDLGGEVEINSDSIEAGLLTLVIRGNASYFNTGSLNTRSVSLELEDVITVHLMEGDGRTEDGPGALGKQQQVKALLAEPAADNTNAAGLLDTDGYALNGAFSFSIDRSAQRAHLDPSPRLLQLCPFNPTRPETTQSAISETCVTRRDVRFRDFPWRTGAVSTAMEISHSAFEVPLPATSTEAKFLKSVFGDSKFTSQLASRFASVIDERYDLDGRFKRAYWINPGYEWVPTQTGEASLFQLSQKVFLFALVTMDEKLSSDAGKSIFDEMPAAVPEDTNGDGAVSPNLPRTRRTRSPRRMLLALDEQGTALSTAELSFKVSQRSMLAATYNVSPEYVGSFLVEVKLTPQQACASTEQIIADLRHSFVLHFERTAPGSVFGVEMLSVNVDRGDAECNRRAGSAAWSTARAVVEMLVVFAPAPHPSFDLNAFASLPNVLSISPIAVPPQIGIQRVQAVPIPFPPPSGDGDSSSIGIATIIGASCGGAFMICLGCALALRWSRRNRSALAVEVNPLSCLSAKPHPRQAALMTVSSVEAARLEILHCENHDKNVEIF